MAKYWRKPDRFARNHNYSPEYLAYINSRDFELRKREAFGLEGGCCAYCGKSVERTTNKRMNYHHINHYRGDLNDIRQIVCICPLCHAILSGVTEPVPEWHQYDPRTPEAQARFARYIKIRNDYIDRRTRTWDNSLASRPDR